MRSILTSFLILIVVCVKAQKLPAKQEMGVRIPANLKIDGKATEWNNQFKAYSKNNDFFYTMANNNDALYLIVQTKEVHVFNKIIDRGLTLAVTNPETGKIASFTFPTAIYNVRNKSLSSTLRGGDLPMYAKRSEADILANNKILATQHRFIKVEGVAGVDSLVSVYNDHGIEAAEMFDKNRVYTLEISVRLKLLGVTPANTTKIKYKLKVNPIEVGFDPDRYVVEPGLVIPPAEFDKLRAETATKFGKIFGGTDFEGEYILAN